MKKKCSAISAAECSPHMSTGAIDKSWATSISSSGTSDAPTLSFQALSLQQPQSSADDHPHRRRCISAEEVDVSTSADPIIKDFSAPRLRLIRKVSLEPRTQQPSIIRVPLVRSREPFNALFESTATETNRKEKRRRNVSSDSFPCLEEQASPKTRKRRRLADRNKALVASDFDQILSLIDFEG